MAARFEDGKGRNVPRIEDLVRRYANGAYHVAWRILRNEHDAMDCVQNAFLRVVGSIEGWRGEGSPRVWILRIVTNEALRLLAKDRRTAPAPPTPTPADRPDQLAALREEALKVRAAVAQLPEAQRETVALRHFAQLSIADIARERGCADGTIKSTLFQAYRKLAVTLGRDGLSEDAL